MLKLLLGCLVFIFICTIVKAEFEDYRCKCVCHSKYDSKVVVKALNSKECTCKHMIEADFCLQCSSCKYEVRNTQTIKGIVFFIVGLLAVLIIYMCFLVCLDPLLSKDPMGRLDDKERLKEEAASYFARVGSAQKRWKSRVQEQRTNIFDRHYMLS